MRNKIDASLLEIVSLYMRFYLLPMQIFLLNVVFYFQNYGFVVFDDEKTVEKVLANKGVS